MILKLATPEDKVAMLQIIGWDTTEDFSPLSFLPEVIDRSAIEGEGIEVIVHKSMLMHSYKSNPSLLAKLIANKSTGFLSASGCEMPDANYVKLAFYRDAKPVRKFSHKYSLKAEIRDWLETTDNDNDASLSLSVDVTKIPAAYLARPEQLIYTIKRETGKKIRLRRLKTKWIFTYENN